MQSHLSVHYTTTPKQVSPPRRKRAIPLRPHTFRVDNAIYDHYGPIIGAIGYAVYCAYSRYANRITGECWPAVETIATQLDLSIPTVIKKRNLLAELGLLSFTERFGPSGRQRTHLTIVHTVDELEGRGKTGLPQDPTPRGKTALPLVEQADLTSSGASTEQEKTYTPRVLEHAMDALKAVELECQETEKQQAKIRALDEVTRQALEAEALEAILRSDPEAKRGFVPRGHLDQVMYQLYQGQQRVSEEQAVAPAVTPLLTEVPDESQATLTGPETDAVPGPVVSAPAAPEPAPELGHGSGAGTDHLPLPAGGRSGPATGEPGPAPGALPHGGHVGPGRRAGSSDLPGHGGRPDPSGIGEGMECLDDSEGAPASPAQRATDPLRALRVAPPETLPGDPQSPAASPPPDPAPPLIQHGALNRTLRPPPPQRWWSSRTARRRREGG